MARVKRELLAARLTCPLCHRLFRDATTISECLHTFCRKCIYDKLTNEDLNSCPTCSISLGGTPVEKLRPDHKLQDVRSKIFPFKRRKVEAKQIVPSISSPVRRKERSLSLLVVKPPRVATPSGLTRRRTRGAGRKSTAVRVLKFRNAVKMEEDSEVYPTTSCNTDTLTNIPPTTQKTDSNAETLMCTPINDPEQNEEMSAEKDELLKPLSCFVEAVSRAKSASSTNQNPVAKTEPVDCSISEENIDHRNKSKEPSRKPTDEISELPVISKARRARGAGRKRAITSSKTLHHGSRVKKEKEAVPLWFSLVSAPDRGEDSQLPQLSSSYLRIKDGTLPVLLIQKYIAQKLDLASETEVEITCRGQAVMPSLALCQLVDLWLQTGSTDMTASAKNFVMVLAYARRLPATVFATAAADSADAVH